MRRAPGFVVGTVLNDEGRAFWTLSVWESSEAIAAYRNAKPHRGAMARGLASCDGMASVQWEQASRDLPAWREAHERLVKDGRFVRLPHASVDHLARRVPAPVERPGPRFTPASR